MHWLAGITPSLLVAFANTRICKQSPRTKVSSLSAAASASPQASTSNSLKLVNLPVDQSKYDALLKWIQDQEGAEIHSSVSIKPSQRGGGYGAFVEQDVAEGELLFKIPRSACVTLDAATNDPLSGAAFSKLIAKAGPGGNTVVLAGLLARERLRSLHHQKFPETLGDSTFGPYLATLPWERGINNQEHTLYWREEDVRTLLPGTMGYDEIVDLRAEVELATNLLNGIIGDDVREFRREIASSGASGFMWPWEAAEAKERQKQMVEGFPEAVRGAFVSLLTRAFQDDSEDKEKLVPLLDILQHSDEPNVSHVMQKSDGAVMVTAKTALKAGDELMNQYRSELEESMPYHRFFTRFGFVPGIVDEPIDDLLREKSSIFFAQKAEI